MNMIQTEHAKLWYAGHARNWPLAAYQLGEIKEIMSDVQDWCRPSRACRSPT